MKTTQNIKDNQDIRKRVINFFNDNSIEYDENYKPISLKYEEYTCLACYYDSFFELLGKLSNVVSDMNVTDEFESCGIEENNNRYVVFFPMM